MFKKAAAISIVAFLFIGITGRKFKKVGLLPNPFLRFGHLFYYNFCSMKKALSTQPLLLLILLFLITDSYTIHRCIL